MLVKLMHLSVSNMTLIKGHLFVIDNLAVRYLRHWVVLCSHFSCLVYLCLPTRPAFIVFLLKLA